MHPFQFSRTFCVCAATLWFFVLITSGVNTVTGDDTQANQTRKPIVTSDLLRVRTVNDIAVSRDDAFAVVAVRSIASVALKEERSIADERRYEYRSHLYWLDLTEPNARPRQLTHGARNDRDPQISPDGRFIAFVRRANNAGNIDAERRSQVWILPTAGGEARQATTLEHGATRPRWSPNSRQLLVSSSIPKNELDGIPPWPSERPGVDWNDRWAADDAQLQQDGSREEIRAWLDRNASMHNPKVITRLNFQDEQQLRREKRFRQLYLVDLEHDGEPKHVQRITDGFLDHNDAAFMPDGRRIVYVANQRTDRHPDRVLTNTIWLQTLPSDTANIDEQDNAPRKLFAHDEWLYRSPVASSDGNVIAFVGRKQDEPSFRQWQLGMTPISNHEPSEPIWLTDEETFDYSIRRFRWHPDRAALLFNASVQGGFPLMTISPGLLKPAALIDRRNGMPVGVHAFDAGRNVIVYEQTSPANPSTVRVRAGGDDRLAFDLNPWVHDRERSTPQENWITREDGTRVQYWVMEPTRREYDNEHKTYPVVLQIHGGPHVMWGPGEMTMWHEFQLLCSWGYGVVYANPRGSGGYGYRFQRANFQDWGHGPAGDVLAALDHASGLDWVDPDRLVVTGGSYAGYLTAWIVAHDHRFQAAVAQRGVYHLPTFFGEGNAWRLIERAMGGWPHEPLIRHLLERESPFNYTQNIETPLLIMHASEDLRTGVSQSEMLYRALKKLEKPVEYVRYPGAGHDLSRAGDPHQRMDRLNRIIDFFERHIDNPRPAPSLEQR